MPWRQIGRFICAAFLTAEFAACGSSGPTQLTLDAHAKYRFDGWGVSLAWWAEVIGAGEPRLAGQQWPNAERDRVLKALFDAPDQGTASFAGQEVHPLGLNVIRYNIGASPAGTRDPATAGTGESAEVVRVGGGVSLPPDCRTFRAGGAVPSPQQGKSAPVDTGIDGRQRDVLAHAVQLAQGVGPTQLEAFANSPPWWLTANGCPAGNARKRDDPLSSSAEIDTYARYLLDVVSAFHDQGIDFQSLEPFNEPGGSNWPNCDHGCQEGANFSPETQAEVVGVLCRELGSAKYSRLQTRPSANDETRFSDLADEQRPWLDSCVSKVNVHGYGDQGRSAVRDLSKGKDVWMSEYGLGPCDQGDGCAGLELSSHIANDLQDLRPSVWVYWQAIERSGGWGLLKTDGFPAPPASDADLSLTPRFWALGQYTRAIRPGSTIYPLQQQPNDQSLRVVAAQAPSGEEVVVATNTSDNDQSMSLALDPLPARGAAERQRVSMSGNEATTSSAGQVALRDNVLDDTLPSWTITTYLVGAARPSGPVATSLRGSFGPAGSDGRHIVDVTVADSEHPSVDLTAAGTVEVRLNGSHGQVLGSAPIVAGRAHVALIPGDPGDNSIGAYYSGDPHHNASATCVLARGGGGSCP